MVALALSSSQGCHAAETRVATPAGAVRGRENLGSNHACCKVSAGCMPAVQSLNARTLGQFLLLGAGKHKGLYDIGI